MTSVDEGVYQQVISSSQLAPKYVNAIDRESAHEILQAKMSGAATVPAAAGTRAAPQGKSTFDEIINSPIAKQVARQAARTVTSQVLRGLFGMLKGR